MLFNRRPECVYSLGCVIKSGITVWFESLQYFPWVKVKKVPTRSISGNKQKSITFHYSHSCGLWHQTHFLTLVVRIPSHPMKEDNVMSHPLHDRTVALRVCMEWNYCANVVSEFSIIHRFRAIP